MHWKHSRHRIRKKRFQILGSNIHPPGGFISCPPRPGWKDAVMTLFDVQYDLQLQFFNWFEHSSGNHSPHPKLNLTHARGSTVTGLHNLKTASSLGQLMLIGTRPHPVAQRSRTAYVIHSSSNFISLLGLQITRYRDTPAREFLLAGHHVKHNSPYARRWSPDPPDWLGDLALEEKRGS